ncbi:DNA topoisomerase IV subunit B [Candidatus Microgenomates bacterium]|nr:DNA topoisomerase IV subunit B [Candidatus Microgenomates bacterium]
MATDKSSNYSGESIVVLEGLEPVRKRPGMYIGSTSQTGVNHCLHEIVDNAVDEALAGYCHNILVRVEDNGYLTVFDDGRGIPVDVNKKHGVSALELVMTKLHAGGKFTTSAYKVSGGLHGVGASVVNALSEHTIVEVKKDGQIFRQEYVKIQNNKTNDRVAYFFDGGILSLLRDMNATRKTYHEPIFMRKQFDDKEVEVAIQYNDSINEHVMSFVNVINTHEGGTHLTGFRIALTRSINKYAMSVLGEKDLKETLTGEDTKEGLAAIVYVKMPSTNLQFEGQTKTKLGNSEVQSIVQQSVGEYLDVFFEENPRIGKEILARILLAQKARLAAKAAKEAVMRKGALEGATLPGKLADCSEKDPAMSEIFLVEGNSAGGTAKQGRNRRFQAILPLRGKVLNTERAYLDKVLSFKELKDLVIALGMGIGENIDYKKLRYHKIFIMTDADVDGEHIRTLLLTFFFRHLPEIVKNGHLYIAMPPLFKIQHGKKAKYAFTEAERDAAIASMSANGANPVVQRYKGLGEMNAEQLWETTMNPQHRIIKVVNVEDAEEADLVFTMLMGDEVPPRKKFIVTHAKMANLDI